MKKVAVIGSRNFTDYDLMKIELDKIIAPFIIVSGGGQGCRYFGRKIRGRDGL